MQKPEPKSPPASVLPVLLAGVFALLAATALVLLLPWFGWVFAVVAAVFGLGAFHYVVWGRWLGRMIRDDVEAEEAAERES